VKTRTWYFVGEVRNAATVAASMRASETGHLVFGTVHAANASQAVQRLVDLFPQIERDLARQTMSLTLRAIVSQVLLPVSNQALTGFPQWKYCLPIRSEKAHK